MRDLEKSDFNYQFHYDNWHNESEQSLTADIQSALNFIKIHNVPSSLTKKDAAILEIGCGMGRFLLALKKLGFTNIQGIDIDEFQIASAKVHGLNVYCSDAFQYFTNHDGGGKSFDIIYMIDVLEHIKKEEQLPLLRLLYKHLSPSGCLVIQTPNAYAPLAMLYRYIDFTHEISHTHITINFLARNAGFCCVTRPSHQESRSVQDAKIYWKNLYEACGYKDVILTENIVSLLFKSKQICDEYIRNAPIIKNTYKKSKFPKWLVRLCSCFIINKEKRKAFRKRYI